MNMTLLKRHHFFLLPFGGAVLCLAGYYAVLTAQLPFLRTLAMAARYGLGAVIPVVFAAFYLVYRLENLEVLKKFRAFGWWLGLLLALVLFGLAAVGLWVGEGGQDDVFTLAGYIPWSDASGYYADALRLLEGERLLTFSGKRPLFPALLSVLLGITGGNLKITLVLLIALSALSVYFFSREAQKKLGPAVGAFTLLMLFLFYRRYAGTVMTENMGLPMGALGFALLLQPVNQEGKNWFLRGWKLLAGLFFLSLGLIARAGPFFILPGLVLWAAWLLRGSVSVRRWEEKIPRFRAFSSVMLALTCAVIVLAMAFNLVLEHTLSVDTSTPFNNFYAIFYGMAHGGEGYTRVFLDHPDVKQMHEPLRSQTILNLALEEVRRNPLGLVKGAFSQWKIFFSEELHWYNAYSFMGGDNDQVGRVVRLGLYALGILGLVRWWFKRDDPINLLVVISVLGVLVSVPMVPPGDVPRTRAYAAAMPVFALLPGLGMAFVLERVKFLRFLNPAGVEDDTRSAWLPAGLGMLVTLLIGAGAAVILLVCRPQETPEITCPSGLEAVVVRYNPASQVYLVPQDDPRPDWAPVYHRQAFRQAVHAMQLQPVIDLLDNIKTATTIFSSVDLKTRRTIWVIAGGNKFYPEHSLLAVCGTFAADPGVEKYHFFFSKSIKVLP